MEEINLFRREQMEHSFSVGMSQIVKVRNILSNLLAEEMANESKLLAEQVHSHLFNQTKDHTKDRGIKTHRFQVLAFINQPSILVEMGFLTHRTEAANLATQWYKDKCALGIAQGIEAFVQSYHSTKGFREDG